MTWGSSLFLRKQRNNDNKCYELVTLVRQIDQGNPFGEPECFNKNVDICTDAISQEGAIQYIPMLQFVSSGLWSFWEKQRYEQWCTHISCLTFSGTRQCLDPCSWILMSSYSLDSKVLPLMGVISNFQKIFSISTLFNIDKSLEKRCHNSFTKLPMARSAGSSPHVPPRPPWWRNSTDSLISTVRRHVWTMSRFHAQTNQNQLDSNQYQAHTHTCMHIKEILPPFCSFCLLLFFFSSSSFYCVMFLSVVPVHLP